MTYQKYLYLICTNLSCWFPHNRRVFSELCRSAHLHLLAWSWGDSPVSKMSSTHSESPDFDSQKPYFNKEKAWSDGPSSRETVRRCWSARLGHLWIPGSNKRQDGQHLKKDPQGCHETSMHLHTPPKKHMVIYVITKSLLAYVACLFFPDFCLLLLKPSLHICLSDFLFSFYIGGQVSISSLQL